MKKGSRLIVILEATTKTIRIPQNISNGPYYCFSFFTLYKSIYRERIMRPMNSASIVYS